jgi:hypothetical protein
MSVSYGGDSITFADGSVQSGGWTGFKNRIINGRMVIDQRNAGASVTVGTGAFSVDRFRTVEVTDGTATAQQSSIAPAGFTNSLLYTVTGTDASLGSTQYASVEQRIEGFNIADLGWGTASAKDVTISFWVRSSVTGIYCVGLYNSGGARSYTAEYTIAAANTWEYKTITVVGDTTGTWLTTNGIGVLVSFTLAVGSSYQQAAGSWGSTAFAIGTSNQTNLKATNGATFYITGVQLERGSTASSFEYRSYGTELQLCQRYYLKNTGIVDGGGVTFATVSRDVIVGVKINFMTEMRSTPTLTMLGTTGRSGGDADGEQISTIGFSWGRKKTGSGSADAYAFATGGFEVTAEL